MFVCVKVGRTAVVPSTVEIVLEGPSSVLGVLSQYVPSQPVLVSNLVVAWCSVPVCAKPASTGYLI